MGQRARIESEAKQAVREVTRFLSIFNEVSAASRLVMKECQQNALLGLVAKTAKSQSEILRQIHGDKKKVIDCSNVDDMRERIRELPHMASAFELKFPREEEKESVV